MVGSANADRYTARRNERLTYILRAPEKRHRFGISALTVGKQHLFTAGRDGTIRAWTLPSTKSLCQKHPFSSSTLPVAKAVKTFDEHVDWVNDVILVHGCDRLVSCSSDTTVKVWNPLDPTRSLRTLIEHTDYVKALAPVLNGVASGSLDGRVLVWDLATGRVRIECTFDVEEGHRHGSIYCMSGSVNENILVSGSTDKTISVWDVRTGDRVVHLRGHSDSVRCLTMKHDARQMLSGATDATVKLWDLRHERCVRSFDSYADGSVWAVSATENFDSFVSGGRDGSVWHTDITGDVASLVVPVADKDIRSNMVLDVALTHCNSGVWVSTTGSTVRLWPLPTKSNDCMADVQDASFMATDPNMNSLRDAASPSPRHCRLAKPLYTIPGLPGIIAHRIMNDRRHVLTCNTQSEFCIWDITRGELEKSIGVIEGADIDDVLKKHDEEVSVPSWFQVDIRLGSLSVRLDKGSAANAEVYAVDAGLSAETEEVKVNIGEHVIRGVFQKWLQEHKRLNSLDEDDNNNHLQSPPPPTQKSVALKSADLPNYILADHIPVIITEDHAPVPILRRTVASFEGNEENVIPGWVVDLVRDGKGQSREVVKISFGLDPAEGSGLPQLSTMSLNAPRVLRVRKVTVYIAKELKEMRTGLDFEIGANDLEILCNNQPLPPTMSLATVRQFRWRSPEDLHLQFRLKKNI